MTAGYGEEVNRIIMPLEDGGGEEGIEIEDEDEAEPVKISRSPTQPTPQQEEEHRIDHYPYRSWCIFCVMGRGLGVQHRHAPGSRVP